MAQFDVYKNTSQNTQQAYPYFVDIQSPLISSLATRVVVPLGNLRDFNNQNIARLTPEISYEGQKLLLLTPQISSVPLHALKSPVGSLIAFRDEIIAALDFAITGI